MCILLFCYFSSSLNQWTCLVFGDRIMDAPQNGCQRRELACSSNSSRDIFCIFQNTNCEVSVGIQICESVPFLWTNRHIGLWPPVIFYIPGTLPHHPPFAILSLSISSGALEQGNPELTVNINTLHGKVLSMASDVYVGQEASCK